MEQHFVSQKQLDLLPERVEKALESNASQELRNVLWALYEEKKFKILKILIVGAGGSYPAALFARQVISDEIRTSEITVATPQTACHILTQFDYIHCCDYKPYFDMVIAISYSGKTPDIEEVYKICEVKSLNFTIITKATKEDLKDVYSLLDTNLISYYNSEDTTGNEKGMISMASTLSPIIMLDSVLGKSSRENAELFAKAEGIVKSYGIPKIANFLEAFPVINVFYEFATLPTAYDIESKFTEAGIANVILHEKKNYSHGRYVSAYNLKSGLNINLTRENFVWQLSKEDITTAPRTNYDKLLKKFLTDISKSTDTPYIEIGTAPMLDTQWNIEALTIIPYLLVEIGNELGIDISKPLNPFPEAAKELYSHKGNI